MELDPRIGSGPTLFELLRERDVLRAANAALAAERDEAVEAAAALKGRVAKLEHPRVIAEAVLSVCEHGMVGLPSLFRIAAVCSAFRAVLGTPDARMTAIRWHGAPRPLRLRFWAHALNVDSVRSGAICVTEKLDSGVEPSAEELAELQRSGTFNEIDRDVSRTFPYHPAFADADGDMCHSLGQVLRCVAVHHPRVQYCQGMNFVVGLMLLEAFGLIEQRAVDQVGSNADTERGLTPPPGLAATPPRSPARSPARGSPPAGYRSPRRLSTGAPISAPSVIVRGNRAGTKHSWFVARIAASVGLRNRSGGDSADDGARGLISAGGAREGVVIASQPMALRLAYSPADHPEDAASVPSAVRLLDVAWIVRALIENAHTKMGWVWGVDLSGLQIALYQFRELVVKLLPRLAEHMRELDLRIDFLAGQWFAPLFANILEWDAVLRVWDAFFLAGWPALFRIALAILTLLEERLLCMDVEQFTTFFREQRDSEEGVVIDIAQIFRVEAALQRRGAVTRADLADLTEQFERNALWQRLEDPLPHVLNVGEEAIAVEHEGREAVRAKMKALDKSIAAVVSEFANQIETAQAAEQLLSATFVASSRAAHDAQLLIEEHALRKNSLRTSLELINGQLSSTSATGSPQLKLRQRGDRAHSAPSLLGSSMGEAVAALILVSPTKSKARHQHSGSGGRWTQSAVEVGDFSDIHTLQARLNELAAQDDVLRGALRERLQERRAAEVRLRAKRDERIGVQAQLLMLQKSHERRVTRHMDRMFKDMDEAKSLCPVPASAM